MNLFKKILINNIKNAIESSKIVANVTHQGLKGSFREGFLIEILTSILPDHFGIGSGVIIDVNNNSSPQADIIIFDKRKLPPILKNNNNGIYPIDSVHRVIEVKSTLDRKGINQSLNMAWCLFPLNKDRVRISIPGKLTDEETHYPLVSCFSYHSSISDIDIMANEWRSDLVGVNRPNVIFCNPKKGIYKRGADGYIHRTYSADDDETQVILKYLSDYLTNIEVEAYSRGDYSLLEWLK